MEWRRQDWFWFCAGDLWTGVFATSQMVGQTGEARMRSWRRHCTGWEQTRPCRKSSGCPHRGKFFHRLIQTIFANILCTFSCRRQPSTRITMDFCTSKLPPRRTQTSTNCSSSWVRSAMDRHFCRRFKVTRSQIRFDCFNIPQNKHIVFTRT